MVVLGAILEGPTTEKLIRTLKPVIPQLTTMIEDKHPRVSYATCWLFTRLGTHCHELIIDEDIFKGMLYSRIISKSFISLLSS